MLAKLINENEKYSVEMAWYNPHGIREVKMVPMDVAEENEGHEIELDDVFHPLLSNYCNYAKRLRGQAVGGNEGFYQTAEVELLLRVLDRDAAYVPVFLACLFGLSMQEVLNLRWSDVNLHHNILTVRNGMTMRMIRLCLRARDFLVTVSAWQKTQYRLIGEDGPAAHHPICLTEEGVPFDAEELERRLQAAILELGFRPVSFDELRLSSAMMLHQHGYSAPEIWSFLGVNNCYFNVLPLSGCQWVEQS